MEQELPIVSLKSTQFGKGWSQVGVGEPVKSHYQYLAFHLDPPHWVLSNFFTREKLINAGRSYYRKPSSLGAWLSLIYPLIKKYIKELFYPKKKRIKKINPVSS